MQAARHALTVVFAFVLFALVMVNGVMPANTPAAEAAEARSYTPFTAHVALYKGTPLTPALVTPHGSVVYCDACGMPSYLTPCDVPTVTFDDGTSGVACPFDRYFFEELTQGERDALREYWAK